MPKACPYIGGGFNVSLFLRAGSSSLSISSIVGKADFHLSDISVESCVSQEATPTGLFTDSKEYRTIVSDLLFTSNKPIVGLSVL